MCKLKELLIFLSFFCTKDYFVKFVNVCSAIDLKRIRRAQPKKAPAFAIDSCWHHAAKRKRETETDRISENVVAFDAQKKNALRSTVIH